MSVCHSVCVCVCVCVFVSVRERERENNSFLHSSLAADGSDFKLSRPEEAGGHPPTDESGAGLHRLHAAGNQALLTATATLHL